MTILDRPATNDALFLWVMHRFADLFQDHAILKGGMALRLLDSPRSTTDIDYVFVPFESKKDIRERIEDALEEIEGAEVEIDLHSKMLRALLKVDAASIQIEANVALECKAVPMTTGGFARSLGQPSQVVRIMDLDTALAHKLAAWNERRLARDLYDCYFLSSQAGAEVDLDTLDQRLDQVSSRIPRLEKRRKMTRKELAEELREAADSLGDEDVRTLGALLPSAETAGLSTRIRVALKRLADGLET